MNRRFAGGIQEYEILLAHGGDEKHCPFRVKKLEESGFDLYCTGTYPQTAGTDERPDHLCGSVRTH